MKTKFVMAAAMLLCALCASAQDKSGEILSKISGSPARKAKVERRFNEERNFPEGQGTKKELSGLLSYDPDVKIMMKYDNGEEFSIDGDIMVIDRDGKRMQFDTSKNLMMRGLSHAILYAYSGNLDELAKEQKARLLCNEKNGKYVVALTALAVSARGYSCIEVTYKAGTCELESIRMDEFNGAKTFYKYEK